MYRVHFFLTEMMFKTNRCGLSVPTTYTVESVSL